jgi:CHAD domain-containing protein
MRVGIRRMRSAFRLLKPYFKAEEVTVYSQSLQRLGWVLGDVRDLDVLLLDLQTYQESLSTAEQSALQAVMDELNQWLIAAREDLVKALDSKKFRRFLKGFSQFLTTPIKSMKLANGSVVPTQVRHLLPGLIDERLAAVLAYDDVLDEADDATLHNLRIEFKRLRYTVSLFESLLGSQIAAFIGELKAVQDCLGALNDVATARARLEDLLEDEAYADVLNGYLAHLETKQTGLNAGFAELWKHFNTRQVQQKLSGAVLALR